MTPVVMAALIAMMGTLSGSVMNNQTQRMQIDNNLLLALMSGRDTADGLLIYMMLKGGFNQPTSDLSSGQATFFPDQPTLNNTYQPTNDFWSNLTTILPMFKIFNWR